MEEQAVYVPELKNAWRIPVHKHYYRLRIWQGRIVAMCADVYCAHVIDCAEIERRLNA